MASEGLKWKMSRKQLTPIADFSIWGACALVHEAAHVADHPHVICERGEYKGERACDEDFFNGYGGGAYSDQVACLNEFYESGLKDQSINPFNVARMAMDLLHDQFVSLPQTCVSC